MFWNLGSGGRGFDSWFGQFLLCLRFFLLDEMGGKIVLIFLKRRIFPFAEGEFSTNSIDEYEFDLRFLRFKRQGKGTQKTQ